MSTLSGHMIIKNGIKFDYPFKEAVLSALPMCDEFIIIEGFSEDDTWKQLEELKEQHPKIKIFREKWEKVHWSILADLTNVAISKCQCEYHYQIQADEALHECFHEPILEFLKGNKFDFIVFGVYHFFSSFDKIYKPMVFYDTFVRLARTSLYPTLCSHGDAMSLGCPNADSAKYKKINALNIKVFHYGYVRHPTSLILKQADFIKLWGIKEWDKYLEDGYNRGQIIWHEKQSPERLRDFDMTHPKVMKGWVKERKEIVESGKLEGLEK
jgi:hypothetical protein